MDAIEVILTRHSVAKVRPDPLARELVETLALRHIDRKKPGGFGDGEGQAARHINMQPVNQSGAMDRTISW